MHTVERSAAGKVILCGEHSVVYGRPAIAVPVSDLRARAWVEPAASGSGLRLISLDMRQTFSLREATAQNTLATTARLVLERLGAAEPDAVLTVKSDIPIASGMGSGAAVAVACVRALTAYLGADLTPDEVSALTYEVEKLHHGTPSGIDNTVVAWEQPIYFVKGEAPQVFTIQTPFHLVIANSGIAGSTRAAVDEVRQRWMDAREYYEMMFNCVGAIARAARAAVEQGALQALGTLMNQNHELLVNMGVSRVRLDEMVLAAREAGALGAKLTGAGQGGNIIALVDAEHVTPVSAALRAAGASHLWHTLVGQRSE